MQRSHRCVTKGTALHKFGALLNVPGLHAGPQIGGKPTACDSALLQAHSRRYHRHALQHKPPSPSPLLQPVIGLQQRPLSYLSPIGTRPSLRALCFALFWAAIVYAIVIG